MSRDGEYVEVNYADNGQIVVTIVNDDEYEALEAWLDLREAEALVRDVQVAIARAKTFVTQESPDA